MRKSRITAAVLAAFGGIVGMHKFYLKKPSHGIMFVAMFFILMRLKLPLITFFIGIIDAVRLLSMSDQTFDQTYNQDVQEWKSNNRNNTRRNTRRTSRTRDDRRRSSQSARKADQSRSSRSQSTRPRFEREHGRRRPTKKAYPKSNPYKQSGIRKFKDYDIKGAIEDFTKALASSPNDPSLHFNLACSYSLNEQTDKSYYHLSKAVANGFKDYEKISNHEALAYLRIQSGFEDFVERGYKTAGGPSNIAAPQSDGSNLLDEDVLLKQLNKLGELRQKGLLTQEEFLEQKRRLMD